MNREPRTETRGGLSGKLLEGVSRSFYLTLKALPQGLREPISLAYLLARTADTLADTPNIPEGEKEASLSEFNRLVQTEAEARDKAAEAALCERLRGSFVLHQEDASEARLLERLPEIFEAYHQLPARLADATRRVLAPIVRGQLLDIRRFPVDGQVRALQTAAELDDYTYLVAGCVGEFWTRVSASELQEDFAGSTPLDQMVEWGIRYGKGLQLVNILRDVSKDIRMGRCYFPAEELAAHGLTLEEVSRDPARLIPVTASWRVRCREHLEQGLRYLEAVRHRRVRYATALPLLLAFRTLDRLEKASPAEFLQGIKVPRSEVATLLLKATLANFRIRSLLKLVKG